MELKEILLKRRSVRQYTGEQIPKEKLEKILQAGLLAASGRSRRPWEFVVVQVKETLQKLSCSREGAAKMLENAGCAIVDGDEHVWLSLANARRIAEAITNAACEAVPAESALWRGQSNALQVKLMELEREYALMMMNAARREILIADRHPFGYLVHELGLTCYAAFPGCSSETSASFETQTKLIEAVKSGKLAYIFVIEGSDRKVAEVVAAETGAEILTLNSLQVVTDYENTTYLSVMRQNLENLKKALG